MRSLGREASGSPARFGVMNRLVRLRPVLALAAMAVCSLRTIPADACACCAEEGERIESSKPLDTSDESAEIARVRFAPTALLYANGGWPDNVRGVADPTSPYVVSVANDGKRFTFTFKTKGKVGTLAFSPRNVESFAVDLRDGKPGREPTLYKEWRLEAPVAVTGIFSASASSPSAPTIARLVLQGRGNVCWDASQLTHWMLDVRGKDISYRFYGKLRAPAAAP